MKNIEYRNSNQLIKHVLSTMLSTSNCHIVSALQLQRLSLIGDRGIIKVMCVCVCVCIANQPNML